MLTLYSNRARSLAHERCDLQHRRCASFGPHLLSHALADSLVVAGKSTRCMLRFMLLQCLDNSDTQFCPNRVGRQEGALENGMEQYRRRYNTHKQA